MPANFFFDAASDDELELLDHEEDNGSEDVEEEEAGERKGHAEAGEDEDEEEEEEDDEDDDDEEEDEKSTGKGSSDAQSPWDFASYSSSVGEEHARRHTTSIDEKISKAMQLRPLPISVEDEEEEEVEEEGEVEEDAETDKQNEYLSEDDETAELQSKDVAAKPFFSTVDGVSFHANSFMELNLSRPLLRACETLGYKKPTPIQVQFFPHKF